MRTRQQARRIRVLFTLGLICVALAVVILFFIWIFPQWQIRGRGEVKLAYVAQTPHAVVGDGVVFVKGGTAAYINRAGDTEWTVQIPKEAQPIASYDEDVAFYSANHVWVFSAGGKIKTDLSFTEEVRNVRYASSVVAVHLMGSTGVERIEVWNMQKEKIDELVFEDRKLMSFGFVKNQSALWTISLQKNAVLPISYVATYEPGKKITHSLSLENEVVYDVAFENKDFYVITTNYVYQYNERREMANKSLVYGWMRIDMQQGIAAPVAVFAPLLPQKKDDEEQTDEAQGFSLQRIRILEGVQSTELVPPEKTKQVFLAEGIVCILVGDKIFGHGADGRTLGQYALPRAYEKVEPIGNSATILGVVGEEMFMYTFK